MSEKFDPIEVLTPKQVAAAFKVTVRTISNRVKAGKFPPPAHILGRPRWRRKEVEEYVEKQFGKIALR
ncbi:helix-turn-helix domain-containing protein [uncultured Sutterella sp.]|uniref:helix-turn-helix transcriptional regulator n=1 Tax=uncultured Sutterella sp. TaxID=286133 RepID=UPI0026011A80|nr:helix-turn-helix domain-containing protein [uncultured Sutterella sp.]